MIFKPYQVSDKLNCLNILKSNQPQYFNEEDLNEFEDWLENGQMETYWILIDQGKKRGCGGIFINDQKQEAGFAWGMIHKDDHRQGYGTALTQFRLKELAKRVSYPIRLCTSQHTYQFYEHLGFTVSKMTPNGFDQNLDRYDMLWSPQP